MHNDTSTRDNRKCLMPDPERCGRSPKDITKERVMALDLEERHELFARKVSLCQGIRSIADRHGR